MDRPSASRRLLLAHLVNSVGDGAFYVTSALFLVRVVGLSAHQVGLGLTVGWAAGFLAGVPLGALADRLGARRTAVGLAVGVVVALAALQLVGSFPAFVAVMAGYGVAQSGLGAVRQALVGSLADEGGRTLLRARLQVRQNAGLAAGAVLGGLSLATDTEAGYRAVLALDLVAFALAAVLLSRIPRLPHPAAPAAPQGGRTAVLRDAPYAAVAGLAAVMLLYMPLLSVVLPLWVVGRTDAPPWLVSALFVLNTVGVMAGQVRVAGRVRDLESARRAFALAGVVMLLACAVFAASGQVHGAVAAAALLAVAGVLQVSAEMLTSSSSWHFAFDLAPQDRQGQYQGLFVSGVPVARMVGPALLTFLLLSGGVTGWLLLGALFVAAGLAGTPVSRWAERTRRCARVAVEAAA